MRLDWYTKFVLSVIAACLVWLSLGGPAILPGAQAQSRGAGSDNRVVISGWVDATGQTHLLNPAGPSAGIPVAVLSTGGR